MAEIAKGYYAHVQKEVYAAIKPYLFGKSVLDCGCVGNSPDWHDFMSSFCQGRDADYVGVDIQNDIGIPGIVIGNAETIDLKRKFDVVLSGDMLALLPCQGVFMRNMNRHLKKGGLIIVTHSNCSGLRYRLRGSPFDHLKTCKHDEETITGLLKIHGFRTIDVQYFAETSSTWKRRLLKPLFIFKPKLQDWIMVVGRKERDV